MKILFCSSEVVPFAKTGGLADVAGSLPVALENEGHRVCIIMPAYRIIKDSKLEIQNLNNGISFSKIGKDVTVYFVKKNKYYDRDGLYTGKNGDYSDNLERFSYLCRKTLDFIKQINFRPDIIHCNDWQTALIPVYLKTVYKDDNFFSKIKTIFTIHNLEYQGLFNKNKFHILGLDWSLFTIENLEFYGKINVLKGGLIFSDCITTVSPTYANEIQTKKFGAGLEGILKKRKDRLSGILNGLDYSIWDPEKDNFIFRKFNQQTFYNKCINKKRLQQECNLSSKKEIVLAGVVSRLAHQKGIDLLVESLSHLFQLGIQVIILGVGDIRYHKILKKLERKFAKKIKIFLKFDDCLAHRIYAGSDIFLMPSRYEPCGLGQMISFKYGTIPVVFKTGGLSDTVKNFNGRLNSGNGFVFDRFSKKAFQNAVKKSIETYKNKHLWEKLVRKAMTYSFSWEESAKKYIGLYKKVLSFNA